MALPPTSEYRGVAASITQPDSEEDISTLHNHMRLLTLCNSQLGESIEYRDPTNDQDIREAVYRWDTRPQTEIFYTGFRPRDQGSTTLQVYYDLERHVNRGGAPGTGSPVGRVFVSTTRLTSWRPIDNTPGIIYRYEIFAPGGIDAVLTLRENNNFPNQQEITFVGGIARQYIRTVRVYRVSPSGTGQFPTYTAAINRIYRSPHFNPNPNSSGGTTQEFRNRLRNVRCPRRGEFLINISPRNSRTSHVRERDIEDSASHTEEIYVDPGCNVGHYVDCAFNFNYEVEAFIFTADQCLRINYAPGTTNDYIIEGPTSIGDFFPSLRNTIFASGADAAFTSSAKNEVYIFRSNIYVLLNFVSRDIIGGPKKITDGFHSFKDTIFEHGIDAAFTSTKKNEAYIFRGDEYALINFAPGTTDDYFVNNPKIKKITIGFPSLKDTVFQYGLDAAFTAKAENEAYIFKDNTYALINFAPHSKDDKIINQVTPISDGFHSLKGIIPSYPCDC